MTTNQPNPNKHDIKLGFKPIPMLIAVAITLIIWFVIPVPEGVKPNAWHMLALFIGTIVAIIGKAMPIGALSILAIALVAVTGVTSDKPADALKDAMSSFSNSLIWLIAIAVIISYGLTKTGLGSRIGYYFISIFGKKNVGYWLCVGNCRNGVSTDYPIKYRSWWWYYSPNYESDFRIARFKRR